MGTVETVRIAKRTGFCYGVREAIDKAKEASAAGKTTHTLGQVVHNEGVVRDLQSLGIETGSDVLYDGSGLSRSNRLSAATLVQVLQVAARVDQPALRALITGLPVAGFTGSLANRFAEADAVALGDVRAKTGTLSGVSSLAGLVTGRDGLFIRRGAGT